MRQDVPIALVEPDARFTSEFAKDYPLLAQYLQSRYRKAGRLDVERAATVDVWVDKSVAMGTDPETRLPCELQR